MSNVRRRMALDRDKLEVTTMAVFGIIGALLGGYGGFGFGGVGGAIVGIVIGAVVGAICGNFVVQSIEFVADFLSLFGLPILVITGVVVLIWLLWGVGKP